MKTYYRVATFLENLENLENLEKSGRGFFLQGEPGDFLIFSQFWANVREKIRKSGRGSFYLSHKFFLDCMKCMNPVLIVLNHNC